MQLAISLALSNPLKYAPCMKPYQSSWVPSPAKNKFFSRPAMLAKTDESVPITGSVQEPSVYGFCDHLLTKMSLRKKKEYPLQSLSSSYSIKRSDYFMGSHSVYLSIHPFGQSVSLSVYKSIGQSVSQYIPINPRVLTTLVGSSRPAASQPSEPSNLGNIYSINQPMLIRSVSQPAGS